MTATLSTHVLDATLGLPAAGLTVTLVDPTGAELATATTDDDGRIRFDADLGAGPHHLTYATGPWFAGQERDTFFPTVDIAFEVDSARPHLHVALLLNPFAYTVYRGS